MFSNLHPFRFVAALLAAFLVVAGLQGAATAATARSVSTSVTPAVSTKGATATFSGKVTKSAKGTALQVQRKSGSRWVKAASTRTTNSSGSYSVKLKRPKGYGSYSYRVYAPATKKLRAAASRTVSVLALNRAYLSLTTNPKTITAGAKTNLAGAAYPFKKGTAVTVQRLSSGAWKNIAGTVKLTASGTFAASVTLTATTTLRAVLARSGSYAPAYSSSREVAVNPKISTTSLPKGTRFKAYSTKLAALGGVTGTWTASNLPAGLKLAGSTGVISGTPTKAGDTQVRLGFTQKSGGRKAAAVTLTLRIAEAAAPVIATTSLPDGTVGAAYLKSGAAVKLTATGNPVGTWASTTLPAGLTLNGSTGVISGTPTTVGSTDVTVQFTQTNTGLKSAPRTFTVKIVQRAIPVIATSSLPVGTTDGAAPEYDFTLTAVGNPTGGTWSADNLPDGLVLVPATGRIHGFPTTAGDKQVTIGYTDSFGLAATPKILTLQVDPGNNPVITTSTLPNATRLSPTPYSTTLTAAGNPVGTWTATPLPAGLTLNQNSGVISGTATTVGDTDVVITFTETATGLTSTPKTLRLTVVEAPAPVITTTGLAVGTRFTSYTTTLEATSVGSQVGTWVSTPLPAGLSLDKDTGIISGTPTQAGDTAVTFGFTQTSTGVPSASKTLNLHVNQVAPPVITTGSLPEGTRFGAYTTTLTATGTGSTAGTWTTSALPAGLSLNPTTGVISGTPTVVGDTAVTIGFTQTNSGLPATPKTLNLHIGPAVAPTITTPALPDARSTDDYSFQMTVAGNPVGTWSATGLPAGLKLNATTGQITGNPGLVLLTFKRTVTFKFTQTNTGLSTTKALVLYVRAGL